VINRWDSKRTVREKKNNTKKKKKIKKKKKKNPAKERFESRHGQRGGKHAREREFIAKNLLRAARKTEVAAISRVIILSIRMQAPEATFGAEKGGGGGEGEAVRACEHTSRREDQGSVPVRSDGSSFTEGFSI